MLSILQNSILDESVRWLFANGNDEEAHRIIKKAARANKKSYNEVITRASNKYIELEGLAQKGIMQTDSKNGELNDNSCEPALVLSSSDIRRYTALTILNDRRILINSLILWFVWYVCLIIYYNL